MALNFTSDILPFYATNVATDANYQSPGNFGLTTATAGTIGVDHVTVGTRGSYTTVPTATAATGTATFTTFMRVVTVSAVAAAGTVYAPGNILTLVGGTQNTLGKLTVATCKLVSATIVSGGTGYGATTTLTATVAGGTQSSPATISVTSNGAGVVTTVNSVTAGGSYTVLPTLAANAVTGGTGTGLTLNLVFGVNTTTITQAGVYSALPSNPVATTVNTGSGTGATFTLAWGVDSITVANAGSYLTGSAPVVNFSSGAATATAVLGTAAATATDVEKLLVVVEMLRSLVAETTSTAQLKDLHEVLRKMMLSMKFGGKLSYSAATTAANVVDSAMRYIAKNPTHGGAAI